jgi:hypothetical protein
MLDAVLTVVATIVLVRWAMRARDEWRTLAWRMSLLAIAVGMFGVLTAIATGTFALLYGSAQLGLAGLLVAVAVYRGRRDALGPKV